MVQGRAPALPAGEDFTDEMNNVQAGTEDEDETDTEDIRSDLAQFRSAVSVPPSGASIEKYREALDHTQKLYIALRAKYVELSNKCALLEARQPKRRRNVKQDDLEVLGLEEKIKEFARQYAIMRNPWIHLDVLRSTTPPQPNLDLNSRDRWASPQSIFNATVVELQRLLPAELRGLMGKDSFAKTFLSGMSGSRSDAIHEARNAFSIITSMPAELFVREFDRKKDATCQSLLRVQGNYTKFAPAIFADPKAPRKKDMLKTMWIVKVLQVTLFGKTSLTGSSNGRAKGIVWGIRSSTAGLIAAGAIMVIFLLSPDKEFSDIGRESNINYKDFHSYYCQILLAGDAWAQSIFTYFNDNLFSRGHNDGEVVTTSVKSSWEEEFERAMRDGTEAPVLDNEMAISGTAATSISSGPHQENPNVESGSANLPDIQNIQLDDSEEDDLYGLVIVPRQPDVAEAQQPDAAEAQPLEPVVDPIAKPKPRPRRKQTNAEEVEGPTSSTRSKRNTRSTK